MAKDDCSGVPTDNDADASKNREPGGRTGPRKHPAHGVFISDDGPTIVFDTVCTKGRKPWLATEDVHDLLRCVWMEATAWLVGRYVIMPDHIHLFAAPGPEPVSLENWSQYWKSQFTKKYRKRHQGRMPPGRWQTDHWETRLRRWESYAEKWEYVRYNPVRHKLVVRPEDRPFQGIIYELRWE